MKQFLKVFGVAMGALVVTMLCGLGISVPGSTFIPAALLAAGSITFATVVASVIALLVVQGVFNLKTVGTVVECSTVWLVGMLIMSLLSPLFASWLTIWSAALASAATVAFTWIMAAAMGQADMKALWPTRN